ncbi:MAG: hypothetical protein HRU75_13100 [Planctomycetia bacterium]|nr:MAG: hypothetical protein HRU75_13100 [Planctomycetia bacterium]
MYTLLALLATAPGLPPELEALHRFRGPEVLRTAVIQWTVRDDLVDTDQNHGAHTRYYTTRIAGNDVAVTHHGDEEGAIARLPDGAPAVGADYNGERSLLRSNGELWEHPENAPFANTWSPDRAPFFEVFDVRRMGLDSGPMQQPLSDQRRAAGLPDLEYKVERDGDLTLVRGRSPTGTEYRWWLDTRKDNAVVRSAVYQNGRAIGQTDYDLEQFDNVWFPARVTQYRLGAGDVVGVRASRIINIVRAEFNRDSHPKILTPEDIGIEVGTSIRGQDPGCRHGVWDGAEVIATTEFLTRAQSGQLRRGPTVTRELVQRGALPASQLEALSTAEAKHAAWPGPPEQRERTVWGPLPFESDWEAYTRRFITRHKLAADQTQRALDILKDCKAQAARFLARHKDDCVKIDEDLKAAKSAAGETQPERAMAIAARIRPLREGVERIRKSELEPRLERVLTTEQRQAAEKSSGNAATDTAAQSQPVSGPAE